MADAAAFAVTPDRGIQRTIRAGLTAAGVAGEVVGSAEELPDGPLSAALVLFHQVGADARALRRVAERGERPVIALVPRGDLASAVDAMKAHDRVIAAMAVDELTSRAVAALVARAIRGDGFGIDKVLSWGARVHSLEVASYRDKARAVNRISELAASVGFRRKHRESIERCSDEMLMNALYDAPIGEDGVPVAHRAPRRSRLVLAAEDSAVIEFGFDGRRFAVGVRDRFGRFERATLVAYLDKCLRGGKQIDDKAGGGAGLGLYFLARSANSVMFNVRAGAITECICTFDVEAARIELEQIGVLHEPARQARPASQAAPDQRTTDRIRRRALSRSGAPDRRSWIVASLGVAAGVAGTLAVAGSEGRVDGRSAPSAAPAPALSSAALATSVDPGKVIPDVDRPPPVDDANTARSASTERRRAHDPAGEPIRSELPPPEVPAGGQDGEIAEPVADPDPVRRDDRLGTEPSCPPGQDCSSVAPRAAAPMCGDGAVSRGEECDDGNRAAGDGCSPACAGEGPLWVSPRSIERLRIAGDAQVAAPEDVRMRMTRRGVERVVGRVEMCLDSGGGVSSLRLLQSTGYTAYDQILLERMTGWRYRPYSVAGSPVPVCAAMTFVYQLR